MHTADIKKYTTCSLLAVAALIVLVASTYKLSEAPAIWLDEGFYSQLGANIAQTGQQAFQVAPGEFVHSSYISVGYPLLYPLALSYKIFGIGVVQGRAVMVVFLLLFAAASYWCIRKLFGPWQAAWSVLVLVSFAELYGNGKSVLGEVPGLFFLVCALVSLWYLEKSNYKSLFWCAALGLATGLCVATKPIFILLPAALLLTLLVQRKSVPLSLKGFLTGLVMLALPLLYWGFTQLGPDVTPLSLLHDYINPYSGQSAPSVASQTVLQNIKRFFTEATPIYTALLTLLWATALFIKRKTAKISAAELSGFFFCILIIAAYLRLPGWYRYLFEATTLALVFAVPSALAIFAYIKEKLPVFKKVAWLPYAAFVLLFLGQAYQVAFSSYVAEYYHGMRTRGVSTAFAELPKGNSVFLYNAPELAVLLPTHNYYQYMTPSAGVELGADQLPTLQRGVPNFVVVERSMATTSPVFAEYLPYKTVDRYDILKEKDFEK